jgi:hypothetical protein
VEDDRRGGKLVDDRNTQTTQKSSQERRDQDASKHGAIGSVTGKSEGVAAVVGGIVDGIGMGKPDPEQKKRAEQNSRQCWNYGSLRLGPHKGLTCLVHYSIPLLA